MEVDLDLTTCWAQGEQYNAGILEIDAFDWGLPESLPHTEVPQVIVAVERLLVDAVDERPDHAVAGGEAIVIKAPTTAIETPTQQATHDAEPSSEIANAETKLQLDGPLEQHIEQSIRTEFAAAHGPTQQEHEDDEEIEQGEQQLAKSIEALEEPVEAHGGLEDAAPRSDATPGEDVVAIADAKDEAEELGAPAEDFDEFSTLIMDLDLVTAPENAFDAQSTEIKDDQDIDMPQQDQATEASTATTAVVPKLDAASATQSPTQQTLPLRDSIPIQQLQPAVPSSPSVTLPELVSHIRETSLATRTDSMKAIWQQRARSSTPALLPSPMPDVVVRQPMMVATNSAMERLVNTTWANEAMEATPDSDVHGDDGGGEVIADELLADDEEGLLHLIEQTTSPVKATDPGDATVDVGGAAAHIESIESPEVLAQPQFVKTDSQLKRELSSSPDPLQGPPTKKARLLDASGVTEDPVGSNEEEGEDGDISMGEEHADTSKNDDGLGNNAASLEILKSDLPTPTVTKKTTRAAAKARAVTDPPTPIAAGKAARAKTKKIQGVPTDSPATTNAAKKPRAISKRTASASSDPAPANDTVKKPRAGNKRTLSAAAGSAASADAETTPPAKIRRVSGVSSTEMRALVNQSVQKRIITSPNVKTRRKTQDIAESKPSGAAAAKKRHSKG
ncbi:hypothetical protein LTR56_005639 [Elasticomyces elasticus]|nr:hypothetical protein LTR56_005639 [Elasticomyces elasticus]KAK4927380.1 hypothetical protein LTR49_005785 [Elasticomyces elasticus]KAK5763345.1 hypothetical protein LTS12_006520 [Elasticomyces elasticus]